MGKSNKSEVKHSDFFIVDDMLVSNYYELIGLEGVK